MHERRGPLLAMALAFALVVAFSCETVWAHKLDMDLLSVRFSSNSREFDGQLLLDPNITRGNEEPVKDEAEREAQQARLLSFVKEHVVVAAGSEELVLSFEVRELYEKGGAVPGDSVIFRGKLPSEWQEVSVQTKEPMGDLAVTASVDNLEKAAVLVNPAHALVVHQAPIDMLTTSAARQASESKAKEPPLFVEVIRHIGTGFVHIIPLGWDHILFVLALTLGSIGKWRRLVLELSAFTLAHTLTLALASLELVQVSPSIVEPLIAFSISAVAIECLVDLKKKELRYALVIAFGLLHGLGFAGALLALGLSKTSFLAFLVSFNIGVELGQLGVVAAVLALIWLVRRWPEKRKLALGALTAAIAACGMVVGVLRLVQ